VILARWKANREPNKSDHGSKNKIAEAMYEARESGETRPTELSPRHRPAELEIPVGAVGIGVRPGATGIQSFGHSSPGVIAPSPPRSAFRIETVDCGSGWAADDAVAVFNKSAIR